MIITKEVAQKIEACIKQSHHQVTRLHAVGAELNVGSGTAFFSGKDSFFTQVIAWGFETSSHSFSEEIKAIETFYRQHQHPQVDIEFCPLAGDNVAYKLSKRGYLVTEMNNISTFDLTTFNSNTLIEKTECRVEIMEDKQLEAWASCVAIGFDCPQAQEQFYLYAKSKNVTAFGIFLQNKLVAGGTIAIHDGICDLGITSTLPAFRGRGLQKVLLNKRMEFAFKSGARIATVTTEPGSVSDQNTQKMGFQIAYTRIKFTFPLR